MLRRLHVHLALLLFGAIVGLRTDSAWCEQPQVETSRVETSHLETYTAPDGENYFALSLVPTSPLPQAKENDVVILFDTSASQTGPHRTKALEALQAMLARLGGQDRVKLIAVDVKAVPLTDDFVAAGDVQLEEAVAKLEARTPLGSTDMRGALEAAASSFAQDESHAHAVVYVGDGINAARAMDLDQYRKSVEDLAAHRASVSSLAIGPRKDNEFLARLANHTGGVLAVDSDDIDSVKYGEFLAAAAQQPVVWPAQVEWPAGLTEIYPAVVPPLRGDREMVVIGKGTLDQATEIAINASGASGDAQLTWTVEPKASDDSASYLVPLVNFAAKNDGWGLPTPGRMAMHEAQRIAQTQSLELNKLGRLALANGELDDAEVLARRAAQLDPASIETESVRRSVERKRQGDQSVPTTVELQFVGFQDPATEELPPAAQDTVPQNIDPLDEAGSLIDEVQQRKAVIRGQAQTEVRQVINAARSMMGEDPARAIDQLKLMQERMLSIAELDPAVRSQLRDQLNGALREASRQQFIKTERDLENQALAAAAEDRRQVVESLYLKEEKIDQLMKRFEALVDQEQYLDAEILAREARELDRHRLATGLGETEIHMKDSLLEQKHLQYRRQVGLIDTLASVERSDIPFPDEPPIVYPDPEVWQQLTKRRQPDAVVELSDTGEAEKKILKAMDEMTDFPFLGTPLEEVITYIGTRHNIPVHLVRVKLEEAGITPDSTEVNLELRGVTLRSALRQLTREVEGLTYLIDNEILQFTSTDDADSRPPVIKVYPVADLVVPIQQGGMGGMMGGGMMGGGMGGGGMGMGGGGMGGGGMGGMGGGGMGGMGGGMGGGGGFFNIPAGMRPAGNAFQAPNVGGSGVFSVKDDLRLSGKSESKKDQVTATPDAAPVPAAPTQSAPARVKRAASTKQAEPQKPTVQKPKLQKPTQPVAAKASPDPLQVAPLDVTVPDGADAEQIYNDYFATHEAEKKSIAETAGQLMRKRKFDEVTALIRAALRNELAEPWMYEALSLAMQASGSSRDDIERALLSAVDFCESPDQMMYLAAYLSRAKYDDRALELLHNVHQFAPQRTEPLTLGLSIAERSGNLDGIRWTTTGILSQAWPKDQVDLWNRAQRLSRATLERMRSEGQTEVAAQYEADLQRSLARDCVAVVSWTGDCDVDLTVFEPTGTQCSFRNPRTTAGGVMLGDAFSRTDSRSSANFQEAYVCPVGFDGTYRVLLRRVWGKPTAGKVSVDVYTHYGTDQQTHVGRQIPLGEEDSLVNFDLKDGRRTEDLDEQLVANAAADQIQMKQNILAQQLNAISDSPSLAGLAAASALGRGRLGFPPMIQGAVGYSPIIQRLPKGALLAVLPSVISADRRYLRVTPSPQFMGVSEVNTFNYASGASGTSGGAGFGGFSSTPGAGGVGT